MRELVDAQPSHSRVAGGRTSVARLVLCAHCRQLLSVRRQQRGCERADLLVAMVRRGEVEEQRVDDAAHP